MANQHPPAPALTIGTILEWADAHHAQTGDWPRVGSGPVRGQAGETWAAVHIALLNGSRGLAGGSSLPALLREHRGAGYRERYMTGFLAPRR